ncbi:hypothetical protein V7X02_05355 [Bacillus altitudinis]|uniref:hypothetical protein n=1 Tax=Bacillus TaxID=1386 RepID=UPI0002FF6119|nr:hypothetical protein [Bacillus altitudinis]MBY0186375.1 hypothetical protein [Bacillus aerophilus]KAJ0073033.1 hypothetical protein DBB48_009065 [Bacillus altitudinis]MBU8967616.1 hypothetical protein [Bacillus altitudinis]MCY7715583.1 hypothetical protein [Bacillus altitudinis]MDR7667746.1 hypothetical protein [Bacillus altitudinis]
MKKFLFIFMCIVLLSACSREDEGKDRRLVASEHMLEAITEGNKRKMENVYVEGAVPSPSDILKSKKEWGIETLSYEDFQLEEASIHVFHANYKDVNTGEKKALAFRVKEDPEKGGVRIDFVGVVEGTDASSK